MENQTIGKLAVLCYHTANMNKIHKRINTPLVTNEGNLDRFIRIIIGGSCILTTAYIAMPFSGVVVLGLVGLYLLLSGLTGNCLFYRLLGYKTN